jgi:tetratricopeptide (TPR) repeat protein
VIIMQSHHLDSKAKISENLGQAIYTNNLDALESIIAQGINIDLPIASPAHTKMLPPLFIAALCGHTNSVELLIENGASTCDKTGVLPNLLYWVCKCKDQDDRDELLEYLATEQIPFQDGTSTDHILAAQGRLENFDKTDPAQRNKLLIPNHSGYTPFFFAMLTLEEDVKDVVLNISPLQIIEAIWIKPLTTNYDEKFLLRHLAIAIQEHSNMGYVLFADDNLNVGFKCEQVLNLAIEKARAVVPVTLEDQTIPDVFYRHLAKLFFQKIKYLLRSKKIQEALECNLLEIKNYEQIQTLAVADNASLYTAHSLTSYFYKALGDECVATKNWQEAIQFYQKAYDANEKISPRNESDYPSLHKAYCLSLSRAWQNYGQDHDMKLNYKAAVDCFEKALNVLRRLQPTLAERLDILRHLSNSLLLLAQEQNKLKNWFSVIELLQRVLV